MTLTVALPIWTSRAPSRTRMDPTQIRDMVRDIMQEFGGSDAHQVNIEPRDGGHGVDIHINIPHGNQRQSLARLRRDYLLRVERQARHILRYIERPSSSAPSPDHRVLHLHNGFLEPSECHLNELLMYSQQLSDDVVLRHTFPVFTGLGRCPIVSWDFPGAVSIFGPDALPVIHQ